MSHIARGLLMRSLFTYFSMILLLNACATEENSKVFDDENHAEQSADSIITATTVTKDDTRFTEDAALIFAKDSTETLTQKIYEGDILTIQYDLKRMSQCESSGRNYLQHLTGFYQVDQQQVQSFDYIPAYTTTRSLQSAKIKVPQGKVISFWFYMNDNNGCEAWDSNLDQNYKVEITQKETVVANEETLISFLANGEVTQNQGVISGSKIVIYYEIERLKACESVQNQMPQWGIMGHFLSLIHI